MCALSKRSQARVAPAGWLLTILFFGIPASTFLLLFHWIGPTIREMGASWWTVFHVVLIAPLGAMLAAALVASTREIKSTGLPGVIERLRLHTPDPAGWMWAGALAGFMFGGDWADLLAIALAFVALFVEKTRILRSCVAVVLAVLIKRNAEVLRPVLQSVVFFEPGPFYREFFGHFGPDDFMGVPLQGAWWVLVYYAFLILLFNIGGEELWWRGYVLPRQEMAFGNAAWILHGVLWSLFHLFMQPTLWETVRLAITSLALAYVVQRTANTWTGVIGHAAGNVPFFLSLLRGL